MKTKETNKREIQIEVQKNSLMPHVGYQHTKRDLFEMKDIICNTKF